MMRIVLKTLFALFLVLILAPFSSAYNSDEYINELIQFTTIGDIEYVIPDGFNLFVKTANITHLVPLPPNTPAPIEVYDGGVLKFTGEFEEGNYIGEYNMMFKDTMHVYNLGDHEIDVLYTGFLIREEEEASFMINGTEIGMNKQVFSYEDIDYIYFREFIIIFFIVIIKFAYIILNKKFPTIF